MSTTRLDSRVGDASDAELIAAVRGGDTSAYGDLFARHRDAATRLARQLVHGPDADDLVSEAFAKVLNVLLGGGGPDVAFRAYLLTAVRRLHVDRVRATARTTPTDDLTPFEEPTSERDTVIAGFEGGAAARAFASLPERWQLVLWHLEVEGQKPAEVAPLLGMSANSVSALAYRAREGLRQAYLQMHTADLVDPDCRWTHDKLGGYVRNGLSRRDTTKVEDHLDQCRPCTAMYLELREVNSSLGVLLGPVVLGSSAAAYLGTTAGTTAGAAGIVLLLGRVKDSVLGNVQVAIGVTATAAAAGVITTVALVNGPDRPPPAAAIPEPTVVTTPATPATPPATTPTGPTPPPAPPPATTPPPPVVTTPAGEPAVADPSPHDEPGHRTEPDHNPPPDKPEPTPTTPPPPPPPPPTADVSVDAELTRRAGGVGSPRAGGLLGSLVVSVRGVPTGGTTTLTVHVAGGILTIEGSSCRPRGGSATCQLGPGQEPLVFGLLGLPISANVRVTVPEGYDDPDRTNNRDSVVLGGAGAP